MARYSKEVWDGIIKETYEQNNMRIVANKYGVTSSSIKYQLDARGLPPVSGGHRKLKLNENCFNALNESSAYWLGFIMADGSVTKSSRLYKTPNRLSVNLSFKDFNHLVKLKEFLQTDSKIQVYLPKNTYAKHKMCRLIVNSVKLCNSLKLLGITERKTGFEKIPHLLPDRLIRHFIRGFFDGDGSITETVRSYPSFRITSNKTILEYIQIYLVDACDLNYTKIAKDKRHDNIYSLNYTGTQTQRIYRYLYKDSSIYLERKESKFNLLLSK